MVYLIKSYIRSSFLFCVFFFLLASCASIKPRQPDWAAVQDIKVVDKEKTTHVGIFVPEGKHKSVQQAASLDTSTLDQPPLLTVTLKNADIARTKLQDPSKIQSNAIFSITSSYEDMEDATFAKVHIALTNSYPWEVIEKPFGYEVIIQKDRPPLEQFLNAKVEKKEGQDVKEISEEEPIAETSEPSASTLETSAPEVETPVISQYESPAQKVEPANITGSSIEFGNRLILRLDSSSFQASLNIVEENKYVLVVTGSQMESDISKKLSSYAGDYESLISSIQVLKRDQALNIILSVKDHVYPILKQEDKNILVKFEQLFTPTDDFGSYIHFKKNISSKKLDGFVLKDTKVSDALKHLAQFAELNFVIDPGLTDRISLRLQNISWDAAFSTLLQSQKLGFVREKDEIIRITKLAHLIEEKKLAYEALKLNTELTQENEIAYFPLNFIKASELEGRMKDLLSEKGNILIDKASNALIVYDSPSFLKKINRMLRTYDQKRPEIAFETYIIRAEKDFIAAITPHFDQNSQSTTAHFKGKVKDRSAFNELINDAEKKEKIKRILIPQLVTVDRKEASFSTKILVDDLKTEIKLSFLPKILKEDQILIDMNLEKEASVNDDRHISLNTSSHMLISDGNTAMVGAFTSADNDFFILITPTIRPI
ncbi:MAG: hypothetical protein HYS98_07095 [Deltaproteobacteria bacterium]|nr:hypothetical protein [Deltaproteobacteria bacterium]